MNAKTTKPTLTTSVTMQPSVKYDLIPWGVGDSDDVEKWIGLSLAELRERLLSVAESEKYDLIVWHNGNEERQPILERDHLPDGAVHLEDHIGMTGAELRDMVTGAEREPMTDAEILAQWAELGRVMQYRSPEVMRCYMDMADAFLAKLSRKEVRQ